MYFMHMIASIYKKDIVFKICFSKCNYIFVFYKRTKN